MAENGETGVDEFREWRPQFIWMDLRMPVMDGIEATKRIRVLDGGQDVKIAAVTASGLDSHRSEVLAAGLDDYVRKPYRPDEIFDCMRRHLGVRYRRAHTIPERRQDGRRHSQRIRSHNCLPHCASSSVMLSWASTRD